MNAVTISVTKNGYLVRDAQVQTDGQVAVTTPVVQHVFSNVADLSYWLTGHLDAPIGEA